MKRCVVWFLAVFSLFLFGGASAQVVISEFMASNSETLLDSDGESSDWVELFNPGPDAVDLEGWYLTDDEDNLTRWRFPAVVLPANSYLVVFASGKDRRDPNAQLHTSFSLDVLGEYLALVEPDGRTIAAEFRPEYPEQSRDISYGLYQGVPYYFSTPTPGAPNGSGFFDYVSDTRFSHDRGFYTEPFNLTISTPTPDAVIRYTTNGTPPSLTNGMTYTGPIPIRGTTVLRAAAFKEGLQPSNIDTHTYLFLADVIRQSPNGQAPPGWPASWGANSVDYGMDPDIVDHPSYRDTIINDLRSIPSFSIVMDLKDLFDPTRGIYANPGQDGRAWERPTSVELIFPDGREGFQVDAGIRIRGGFSRSTGNPKHAFRLFFREEYGDAKLIYPLFGDDGAEEFDALDLRTFQNYSWSFQGDQRGTFLRDQFSRDTQLDMGRPATRGDYYHLYINGQYWGLYNTEERPEASYAETYFGGNKEDYDVIKVEAGPYTINATDGNMDAWTELYNLAKAGLSSDAAYLRIQGKNPDGTENPAYPNLVDVPNLIDYMLVILYGGNLDAPISNFLGNDSPNNWYGIRSRTGRDGFRFITHDSEHTFLNVNEDRTGPYPAGNSSVVKSNPQWVWQRLQQNAEFRMLVADHVHRHFFNGGALTTEAVRARFMKRKEEIDRAVVAESARWGDAKRSTPLTRDRDWVNAVNDSLEYIERRSGIVLNQLRQDRLYPSVAAPSFNQHGGNVPSGFRLTMSAPAGTIYYTRDGTDPRLWGGAVSPGAVQYQGPLTLTESVPIKARVLSGTNWSALNEATFMIIQTFTELALTEIMYNPPSEGGVDGQEFEFLELKNVGTSELDLSGVTFTDGIAFTFPLGTRLGPGEFVVLASNPEEFAKKYPGVAVTGAYTGRLANGGERLTLAHAAGAQIFSIEYSDDSPWPVAADGTGFSIVPMQPDLNLNSNNAAHWRASTQMGGSPGADDVSAVTGVVRVNEVLTHTDPPLKDSIELFNPGTAPVDVGYWYLTDNRAVPRKFRIPPGTVIPAGGFLVFDEDDFNSSPGAETSFNLSSHGEEVYLFSADAAGNLTGFSDGFSFGAAENGVSFGRHVLSTGAVEYPPQAALTLGAANAGPRIGPVVINEIRYRPAAGDEEFIELRNLTGVPVPLFDPAVPTNTWTIEGVGFAFPPGSQISANGLALVVASDPSVFRTHNQVPESVPIFGPYPGALQDNGERLRLMRPDSPDPGPNGGVIVPYIQVDAVRYEDRAPWPVEAAGSGASLERLNPPGYGSEPGSWRASVGPASPGLLNDGNKRPVVTAGVAQVLEADAFPLTATVTGTARDDGLPAPPAGLTVRWSQAGGPGAVAIERPDELSTTVRLPGVGSYVLWLTASDGELEAVSDVELTVSRPSAQATLVASGSVWRYRDDGSNQGTAWRATNFDDSGWSSGRAKLGYGEGNEATVVGFGPDPQNKYRTTYFRRAFDVTAPEAIIELTLELLRDDGAIVYLNGTEVFRSNMPLGTVGYRDWASGVVGGAEESTFYPAKIDQGLLVAGRNVLAVEVHQANAGSTDLSFDLRLTGLSFPSNRAPIVQAGSDLTVDLPAPALLEGSFSDDGLPIPPGVTTLEWSKVSGPGDVAFDNPALARTAARFSAPGVYTLRLSATDGQFSATDEVTVTVSAGESFETWRAAYFDAAELADPQISGETADPDGDGHTNGQEFVAGTNPKDAQSVLQLIAPAITDGLVRLRFEAVRGKTYSVEYCDSPAGGEWQKLADIAASSETTMTEVTDDHSAGRGTRYYRVVTPGRP